MTEVVVAIDDELSELFHRHASQIFRYCARRVGSDLAEDIVGEVFLIAVRRQERSGSPTMATEPPEGDGQALPWLYGVATNLLRTHRRTEIRAYRALARTGADPLGGADGIAEGHEGRSAERVDAGVTARRLAGALARLPRRQRDVLWLYAIADLSYGEIAQALDIPLGSVQSALHRARARMRAAIGEQPAQRDGVVAGSARKQTKP